MNSFQHAHRFDMRSTAASREYDAQLGAFAANVAAVAHALAVAGGRVASLLSRHQTSAARTAL